MTFTCSEEFAHVATWRHHSQFLFYSDQHIILRFFAAPSWPGVPVRRVDKKSRTQQALADRALAPARQHEERPGAAERQSASMTSAADKEQAVLKKKLELLLKKPENMVCADCPSRREWSHTRCLAVLFGRCILLTGRVRVPLAPLDLRTGIERRPLELALRLMLRTVCGDTAHLSEHGTNSAVAPDT